MSGADSCTQEASNSPTEARTVNPVNLVQLGLEICASIKSNNCVLLPDLTAQSQVKISPFTDLVQPRKFGFPEKTPENITGLLHCALVQVAI